MLYILRLQLSLAVEEKLIIFLVIVEDERVYFRPLTRRLLL